MVFRLPQCPQKGMPAPSILLQASSGDKPQSPCRFDAGPIGHVAVHHGRNDARTTWVSVATSKISPK